MEDFKLDSSSPVHKGVASLICNETRTQFFVQQKDESYPIEKWQLALSFWGGAMEANDPSPEAALWRELAEELTEPLTAVQPQLIDTFLVESDHTFEITLFELRLATERFIRFTNHVKVIEGYGKLLTRNELLSHPWVWNLEVVVKEYLDKYPEL